MGVELAYLEKDVSPPELDEAGLQIRNISATVDIEGEFDRAALAADLPNSEYDPERHRSLVYRSPHIEGFVVLLPPSGRASLAGAQSREDITEGVEDFMSELSAIGIEREYGDIEVENIVATADLGHTLNLSQATVTLGLESTEYEPEQFPGLIYRSPNGSVNLLYSTGKVVITKTRTYSEVLAAYEDLQNEMDIVPGGFEPRSLRFASFPDSNPLDIFAARGVARGRSSPGRIRTAVMGSKGPYDWPLHHGTPRFTRPMYLANPADLLTTTDRVRSIERHRTIVLLFVSRRRRGFAFRVAIRTDSEPATPFAGRPAIRRGAFPRERT